METFGIDMDEIRKYYNDRLQEYAIQDLGLFRQSLFRSTYSKPSMVTKLVKKFHEAYPNLLRFRRHRVAGIKETDRGAMQGIIGSLTSLGPDQPPIKVSFTLPTFEEKKGHEPRKAEIIIEAGDCHSVTIVAGGKRYQVRHKDFAKVAKWIGEEYC